MQIRVATTADNDQLVKLARLTPMDSTISICIQRDPDFFSLLYKIGEPHVLVAEENNSIIGCVSIVKEEMMVLHQPTTLYYVCDLKVHPAYRKKKIGTYLTEVMHQYLQQQDADLCYSTVADNNGKVMPFFKGKAGIDGITSAGKFYILQLVPKRNVKFPNRYTIIPYAEEEKIITMYRQFASRYSLHPVIIAENYNDCIHFAVIKKDDPVAFISLYDPAQLKQNVLISIPWYYKIAVNFLRALKPVLHTPYMPRIGEAIRILYVKDYAHLPGHETEFLSLLSFANQYAYNNGYSFLSISFHEHDKLRFKLRKFYSFPFIAYEMICSLKNNNSILDKVKEGVIVKDFSLV